MSSREENSHPSSRVQEMINEIPSDINVKVPIHKELGDLISDISMKGVPVGSLNRLWILGSMQAKIALGYLLGSVYAGL